MAEYTFGIFPASKSAPKTMNLEYLILSVLSIDCITNHYLYNFKQLFIYFMVKTLLIIIMIKNNSNLLPY